MIKKDFINLIDDRLIEIVNEFTISPILRDSILYSIKAGGKRLRPLIVLLILSDLEKDYLQGLDVACAIEMIHTYSLIHDDLPAMDDDDYRRGQLTNHLVFGEAMAILAGDALLTESFNVIAKSEIISHENKVRLIQILSSKAGANGMVAGQALDVKNVNKELSMAEVQLIHQKKTKELIEASIFAGSLLAGILEKKLSIIEEISYNLGMAFQVQDDLIDILKDQKTLGKTPGSDEKNQKTTFPNILGLDQTLNYYFELRNKTLDLINNLFGKKHLYNLIEGILYERF